MFISCRVSEDVNTGPLAAEIIVFHIDGQITTPKLICHQTEFNLVEEHQLFNWDSAGLLLNTYITFYRTNMSGL